MERSEIENFRRGISEASKVLCNHAAAAIAGIDQNIRRAQETIKQHEDKIRTAQQHAGRIILSFQEAAQHIAPYLVQLHRAIDQLPQRTRKELEVLANNGWYVDPEMPCTASTELARLFLDGKGEEANSHLEAFFDGHAQYIESRLTDRFPPRAAILREAFLAHRNGSYALSVPVLLAQADVVCKELIGVQLYGKTKNGNSTQVRDAIEQIQMDPFVESLLAPFLKPFAINAGPNHRLDTDLNRHAVLHGESVMYDCFRNSCKAMSLISFTEWALNGRFQAKQ